jgi:uncharacterized membrane protein YeaQ/YmgE (transglycosylase-associated protein family)
MVWTIVGWVLTGLLVGAIARFLLPGRDPMGCLGTLVVGVLGSFLGGAVASLATTGELRLQASGFLGSLLGAIGLLILRRIFVGRRE